jgi:hypothetical protein
VSRLGGDPLVAAASAGILAHGWLLAAGFTAFLASLGLGAAVCAAGVRLLESPDRRVPWPRVVAVSLAFGLLFFVHLAGAVLAAGVWLLLCAARSRAGHSWWREVAVTAAPLVLSRFRAALGPAEERSTLRFEPSPAPRGAASSISGREPTGRPTPAPTADRRVAHPAHAGLLVARAARRRSVAGARWLARGAAGASSPTWSSPGRREAEPSQRSPVPLLFLPLLWATSHGLPARGLLRTAFAVLLVGALAHRRRSTGTGAR